MGRPEQDQQNNPSLRSKVSHFVFDLTTTLLNPISDKPSSKRPISENVTEQKRSQLESISEESSEDLVDGPDTSSFTAFLYSLLSSSEAKNNSKSDSSNEYQVDRELSSDPVSKGKSGKKSLLSRGKHSLGKAISQAARLGGYRNQASAKSNSGFNTGDQNDDKVDRDEGISMLTLNENLPSKNLSSENLSSDNIPETSEPSLLLSEKTRGDLYVTLPSLVQGRKWILVYSTWRHGISISTLYRRSVLCPGLSLLVVGDRRGAVFGGLVEAPLRPTSSKRYQGTNNTFLFTNTTGHPVIYHPTGENRYFTLCSTDYLALGGGKHFALYLDGDLLNGSSSTSETYGNSCLASTKDFEVKEIELWGFVNASKYEEMVSLLRTEAPGISTL